MKPLYKALIVGSITGILGLIFCYIFMAFGISEKVDLDLLFTMRGERQAPSDVIIVSIDNDSTRILNQPKNPEKWQRALHAPFIDNLVKAGASAIVFDLYFYKKELKYYNLINEDNKLAKEYNKLTNETNKLTNEANLMADNLLAEAIRNAGNVALCSLLNKEETEHNGVTIETTELEPPVEILEELSAAVAPFPLPKRRASKYWTFDKRAVDTPSLPVVAFQLFTLNEYDEFINLLQKAYPQLPEQLPLSKDKIVGSTSFNNAVLAIKNVIKENPSVSTKMLNELDVLNLLPATNLILKSLIHMYQPPYRRYLNYYGPPRTFKTIPYYKILEPRDKSDNDRNEFDLNNKVIFVGAVSKSSIKQKDGFYTVFSESGGLDLSGVEIAATAFANILENMPVRTLHKGLYSAIIFLWGLMLGVLCYRFPTTISAPVAVVLIALYFSNAFYQFKTAGIWYPLVVPLSVQVALAFSISIVLKYIHVGRERKNIKTAFRHYLPDDLVDKLARDITSLKALSQQVYGTCLSTDAEQYTSLSEAMDPDELRELINKYYGVLIQSVQEEGYREDYKGGGGNVSNLLADSMMATWMTDQVDIESRKKACYSALDIGIQVHKFNKVHSATPLPTRIGLHSGKIILGSIGAEGHLEYRPVGDIVNTASRIEGLNKYMKTRILLSEEVLYGIDEFLTRELGQFLLVGKSTPIVIHELICVIDDAGQNQINLCTFFSEALSLYRNQSWKLAIEKFSNICKRYGEDGPSRFYIMLCEQYYEKHFEESWAGVIRMDKK
ncbi:MAG: adenylate/guanylate cyclase domain-containing protein [Candidatus Scalindua rubra]|uniref:Guanylate cyclase domain-containing protein n=1 Tax=Candidatus Scalindua brodae TaxID=237368 RepID=A0A0B0EJ34_9BACT|nr:MAG: hypothetical protein SCABRO_01657 [Candidatus Scalindua brodae]MBZ0109186.1 adenylate/guanylate cyclase domain-containing protein [Candidatus Scalindua rubra]TWU28967.1 Adenylate cyclase 1 [Candidatus Brocadiaceae bacterium S225]